MLTRTWASRPRTNITGMSRQYLMACMSVDSAYQEKEREKFAALESKARADKNVMMSRLVHAVYVGVSESLSEAMVESPVGSLVPPALLVPGLVIRSHIQHDTG